MRKTLCVSLIALVLVIALPPSALGAIRIKRIAFDPPGSDTGSNSHINKEVIRHQEHGT